MRARTADAALAALAVLVAAWPLSTLLQSPIWVRGTLVLVLVVAASGIAGRVLALRGWQTLVVQVVFAVLVAGQLYGQGHLWYGLPTIDMVHAFGNLIGQAADTIQSYSAPAPTTRGLDLLVGCSLGLVALSVDYLAVTRRSPSLAGLPLLATFLGVTANTGSALSPTFFLTAAAIWLLLLARQGSALLRRWGTTLATPVTPVRDTGDVHGTGSFATVARSLGVAALVLAVVVPVALPHLPTHYLLSGLGRSDSSTGGGSSVGFSQSLDLAADLNSRSTDPVLVYRTDDPAPPPLQVGVSSRYVDGRWPTPVSGGELVAGPGQQLPAPTGLGSQVPKLLHWIQVESNNLKAPNLAAPYPLAGADLPGVAWGMDDATQSLVVRSRPAAYTVHYWKIEPTTAMLQAAGNGLDEATGEDLSVDPRSRPAVAALNERLLKPGDSRFDQALAIQDYLRADGGFTYSLQLAQKDAQGRSVAGLDPLTAFLRTKQGYCVQFATAMIMMAREAGIPARMAVGFLPGRLDRGTWVVEVADAHAWPELYLDGIGWTRFEPTPGVRSGSPPGYADTTASNAGTPGLSGTTLNPQVGNTGNQGAAKQKELEHSTGPGGAPSATAAPRPTSLVDHLPRGWVLALLTLLLVLMAALVVPLSARWRRRSQLHAAASDAERVEAQWRALTSSLSDLGVPAPPSRTPRQLGAYYHRAAFMDEPSTQALGRVVLTLERARYAVPGDEGSTIEPDVHTVLRAVASSRRRRDRIRAALWPSSGLAHLRSIRRRTARSLGAPGRALAQRLTRHG